MYKIKCTNSITKKNYVFILEKLSKRGFILCQNLVLHASTQIEKKTSYKGMTENSTVEEKLNPWIFF